MPKDKKMGRYVVFEGIDASGKSTQAEMLIKELKISGKKCQFIDEPGGTDIGDKIRAILKDGNLQRTPETNLELFTICRREIVTQRIIPAMADGIHSISDRNWWSSVAYQGFGEGLDKDLVIGRSKGVMGQFFMPDKMIFIDTPIEVIHTRMRKRGGGAEDYFEKKGLEFFEKVRQGYLWLADKYGIEPIDGHQTEEKVHKDVLARLGKTLF